MFPGVLDQVSSHSSGYFGPLFYANLSCSGAVVGKQGLSTAPTDFYWLDV